MTGLVKEFLALCKIFFHTAQAHDVHLTHFVLGQLVAGLGKGHHQGDAFGIVGVFAHIHVIQTRNGTGGRRGRSAGGSGIRFDRLRLDRCFGLGLRGSGSFGLGLHRGGGLGLGRGRLGRRRLRCGGRSVLLFEEADDQNDNDDNNDPFQH